MKLVKSLQNQSIRLLTPVSSLPRNVGRADLIRLVRNLELNYGFMQGPRTVADFNLEAGITFLEGQFADTLITKLAIHGNGLLAEATTPTDTIDSFLDDLILWANEHMGFELYSEPVLRRSYLSQFEVELETSLGKAFTEFSDMGRRIASSLRVYGLNTKDFEVSEFSLHCDLTELQAPRPGPSFTVARRASEPYEKEVYFASAPLPTREHIQLIADLEILLASKAEHVNAPPALPPPSSRFQPDAPESFSPSTPSRPARPTLRRRR